MDNDNLTNIDIDIDIDMVILENINIEIDIDMDFLESIDVDKGILKNIDIDKILYRLEFGISNRAKVGAPRTSSSLYMRVCSSYAFLSIPPCFDFRPSFFPHLSKVEQKVGQQKVEKNISPALVILIADKRPTTKESYSVVTLDEDNKGAKIMPQR